MVQGGDGKWRTMVDDGPFTGKTTIGAICRAELADVLKDLGYGIDKTHPDGRCETEGVPRDAVEAISARRVPGECASRAAVSAVGARAAPRSPSGPRIRAGRQ